MVKSKIATKRLILSATADHPAIEILLHNSGLTVLKIGGQIFQSITFHEVEFNPEIDDLVFSRPKKD